MVSQARQLSFGRRCADHLEAGGDVFEHLALVLADAAEHRAAAARAGAGGFVGDGLARQVVRQRLRTGLALTGVAWRGSWSQHRCRAGSAAAGVVLGGLFLEFADQQLELLDVAVELFRGAAEPCTAQHGQLHLQLLDVQRLGVDLGSVGGDLDVLARQLGLQAGGECAQCLRIGRQRVHGQGHDSNLQNLRRCRANVLLRVGKHTPLRP